MKKCSKCKTNKPLNQYNCEKRNSNKLTSQCKICINNKRKETRRKNGPIYAGRGVDKNLNPEEYVRKNCGLCSAYFFPDNSKIKNCLSCTDLRGNVYRVMRFRSSGAKTSWSGVSVYKKTEYKPSPEDVDYVVLKFIKSKNCDYCNRQFTKENPRNFEHILPHCKGGTGAPTNIAISCLECNKSKGGMYFKDWVNLCMLVASKNHPAYSISNTQDGLPQNHTAL